MCGPLAGGRRGPAVSGDAPAHIVLVGPLPPPAGGMANQTRQLARLLSEDGVRVDVVRQNRPYVPGWIARVPWVRALVRLLPYLIALWRAAGRRSVMHVMANSGWSWHLFAAPAVLIGRWRGAAVVINYRGGLADDFFRRAYAFVGPVVRLADAVVVPSGFLREVFGRRGVDAQVVPNIIDVERFRRGEDRDATSGAHILVARNLERIYDNATAIRAFQQVRQQVPEARLTVAGSGPEEGALRGLADELGIGDAVEFAGHVDNAGMPALYRSAAVALNPSLADNMPISILEALAAGVPVVSTDVGGVPYLVEDGRTALLVAPGDPARMAQAVLRVLREPGLAARLARAGEAASRDYAWESVRERWFDVYRCALADRAVRGRRVSSGPRTPGKGDGVSTPDGRGPRDSGRGP